MPPRRRAKKKICNLIHGEKRDLPQLTPTEREAERQVFLKIAYDQQAARKKQKREE
jgi:hypothetical protein